MQSFEKISKMNLADIDRPGTQDDPDELDTNPDVDAEVDAAESGDTSPEIVTVADVEERRKREKAQLKRNRCVSRRERITILMPRSQKRRCSPSFSDTTIASR